MKDVLIYERAGEPWVRANNRGISLFTWEELQKVTMVGWIWKLPAGLSLPMGLSWYTDRPGHYMLVPSHDIETIRRAAGKGCILL